MNIKLPAGITRTFGKAGLALKKASPEILVVTGIVGTIASTVIACRQTPKAVKILEEHKETAARINEVAEKVKNGEMITEEGYSEDDRKHDLTILYTKTALSLAKTYILPVTLGIASIASILCGHHILRVRYSAVSSALAATTEAFNSYRARVADSVGEEAERDIYYGVHKENVSEKDENGKEVKVTKNVIGDGYSPYAKYFDEGCRGWEKDAEANLTFLRVQQAHANDILKARGWLTLNDVYDMLGIPKTKAGMVVGWMFDEKNPTGDNYVDFGIYNGEKVKNRDFVNGYEKVILLDFNVDGNIYDKMGTTNA